MITETRLAKIFSSLNGVYSHRTPIEGTPWDMLCPDEFLEISKDGLVSFMTPGTKRPVISRVGDTYLVYMRINKRWCYCASSKDNNTLGRHIRFAVRYEHRRFGDFYRLIKTISKVDKNNVVELLEAKNKGNKLLTTFDTALVEDNNIAKPEYVKVRYQLLRVLKDLESNNTEVN